MAEEKKETKKKEKKVQTKSKKTEESSEKPKKNDNHKWYILSSSSGKEKRTAKLIEQRVKANDLEKHISEVVVPTQNKIVIKKGKKETVEERILPGYILVKMEVTDDAVRLVRNTEGVIGFLGSSSQATKPTPLSEEKAKSILSFMQVEQPAVYQSKFMVNDAVKVAEGPFKDFVGTIQEVNETKGQVTVLLSMFGREVPVDLDFLQVTKI